jgi:hypothetical protein
MQVLAAQRQCVAARPAVRGRLVGDQPGSFVARLATGSSGGNDVGMPP